MGIASEIIVRKSSGPDSFKCAFMDVLYNISSCHLFLILHVLKLWPSILVEGLSSMLFKDWGEDNFVQHLKKHFRVKDPMIGIGDDCAVIGYEEGKVWLVTTDALAEGVHFLKEQISARDLGYKTVAASVSDIAAMGGKPLYAFLSIAIPNMITCDWVYDLIEGVKEACKKWEIILLGGDTIGSKKDLFLNLTLIGTALADQVKYRHQAIAGDYICVNGFLGDSGGGLKALQENKAIIGDIRSLLQSHFRPNPNPLQGSWLASQEGVHAMMDISDGLDCDLKRLIKSSQKGAVIETTNLPISSALSQACLDNGWDVLQLALTGGEDYCLLVTISPMFLEKIQSKFQKKFETPLFPIGRISDTTNKLEYCRNGKVISISYKHFDHFE